MDESRLEENRLDENRLDENELDEKWVYPLCVCSGISTGRKYFFKVQHTGTYQD